MNKSIIFILVILSVILLAGQGCKQAPVACTEDARVCPDGTVVVREGPDCEFQKCPDELIGGNCGTVSPDARDECCERVMKDVPHILCVGDWKYSEQKAECEFVCGTTPVGIPKECSEENVVGVYDCKDGVKKVVSGLLGAGFRLIKPDGSEESCPVVAPQYITEECKNVAEEGYCADKNLCE